jgi:hypothetical protein
MTDYLCVLCSRHKTTNKTPYPLYFAGKALVHPDLSEEKRTMLLNLPVCEICLARQIRAARSLAVGAYLSLAVGALTLFAKLALGRNFSNWACLFPVASLMIFLATYKFLLWVEKQKIQSWLKIHDRDKYQQGVL